MIRQISLALLLILGPAFHLVLAQEANLRPKYGAVQKNEAQRAADDKFIAAIDEHYKGDRSKASVEISTRGWKLLRQGQVQDAMRRFNQAWLLDPNNGAALWGMAAIQSNTEGATDALTLFAEAARLVGDDIDFAVDYAKAMGVVGAETQNSTLLQEAFRRFAELHEKAPQHILNLQNWAITLFYTGNYPEAWKKIQLAEATPRRAFLDPNFIAALQSKMPRP